MGEKYALKFARDPSKDGTGATGALAVRSDRSGSDAWRVSPGAGPESDVVHDGDGDGGLSLSLSLRPSPPRSPDAECRVDDEGPLRWVLGGDGWSRRRRQLKKL